MEHNFKTIRSTQEEEGGLQATGDRYHLLKLVERVGKGAGFTPRMIEARKSSLRSWRSHLER